MSIEMTTKYGQIEVSNDTIAQICGGATVECYGIVGMASKNQIKDGIAEILGKENYSRGVVVRNEEDEIHIDLYVIISYGTKISEVAHNVQEKVKYVLKQNLGISAESVNIFVQGVRVTSLS